MSGQHEQESAGQVAVIDPGLLARFAEMATLIPAEDGSDGASRILDQILKAGRWEELNEPWESTQAEKLRGRILRLDSVTRRPSQFRDGLGVFLVLHCTDTQSGEQQVVTSSSVSVIGQVVVLHARGWLPAFVEFTIADRATEAGYYPHHLTIHGVDQTRKATADAGAAEA